MLLEDLVFGRHVASLLMQHVFGMAEAEPGIHAHKVAVALDLIAWQESKVDDKLKVKMSWIPGEWVEKAWPHGC